MTARSGRLPWLDITKGLAILWVAWFHMFGAWSPDSPSPMNSGFVAAVAGTSGWAGAAASLHTSVRVLVIALTGIGFHAVGMFLLVSGWSLTQSCVKQAERGPIAWAGWYRKRLFRLYPLYWAAHVILLGLFVVSSWTGHALVDQFEPVDRRVWYSLLGLRFIDIQSNFFYMNAAWWYFSALIQLYLIFPILFLTMRRTGEMPFLAIACAVGLGFRYVTLAVAPAHESLWWFADGSWTQGGFGLCRLPEFAVGMVLSEWYRRQPARGERLMLGGAGLAVGALAYPVAMNLYHSLIGYVFVDLATGVLFFFLAVGLAGLLMRAPKLASAVAVCGTYSYGIYLLHQPHVLFLGIRVHQLALPAFAVVAAGGIVFVAVEGIGVEKAVNALVDRLSRRP